MNPNNPKTRLFLFLPSPWYYSLRWLILIGLGLAIYAQTFGFGFVFDDFDFIVNNPFIKKFSYVYHVWKTFPKTRTIGFYTFAFNYLINRLDPQGYHIFNFIIHLLAVGLVWATATVLFKIVGWLPVKAKEAAEPSSLPDLSVRQELPFVIAVLFLVHPCQTQAVTYISQRFESIATVFYISSIYFYLQARIASLKRDKVFFFAGSVSFALLGISTKEVAVTIPLMLLAVEFIILNRNHSNFRRFLSRKFYLPIIILGIIFVLLFMKMVGVNFIDIYFNFYASSASHDGDIITGGKYVLTQMRVFLTFLQLLILPVNQNVDYDYPLSASLLNPPLTSVGLCLMGMIIFSIFRLRKQWPLIAFGLAWILITFSINTAPRIDVIWEHKLYLISFGFFIAIICFLSIVIKDRKILFGFLFMLIAILSFASYKRNQIWKNELTLWSDVVQKSPRKTRPVYNRGLAYYKLGDFRHALLDYNRAIEINPNYEGAYISRGILYDAQGSVTKALSDYNQAISMSPHFAMAYYDRGLFYDKQGNFTQALLDYNKAIEIDPNYVNSFANRGGIYVKQGNFPLALYNYNKAIEINSEYAPAYNGRGNVYSQQGDLVRALLDYNKSIEIETNYADGYYDRGIFYDKRGNFIQAISDFTKAIEINPIYAQAYYNRGNSYKEQNDFASALLDYNQAIKINPAYGKAYINRGNIYSLQRNIPQALSDYNKALKIEPDNTELYINRGTCYAQQGKFSQAILDYDSAIKLKPYSTEAYYNRAITYYVLKEYKSAWEDVDKVQKLGGIINSDFLNSLKKSSGMTSP